MVGLEETRPDPDQLLRQIDSDLPKTAGRLKIFFGYAAGVGKTYAMLDEAREQFFGGQDILVGYIEPHSRPETMQLLAGLPVLPPKVIQYRDIKLNEFDLDAALARKPAIILIDELAHTNAIGVRNRKRYQDVEELLNAGIDVYTTVNVQHIESLNDVVRNFTKVGVRETIPDAVFDHADQVELIDFEPDELLKRFKEGKIYRPERAETAMRNFFTKDNLRLLREIAMRKAAARLSHGNQSEQVMSGKMASAKLMVCVSASPAAAKCIRWTARTADAFRAPWVAVYVESAESQYQTEKEKQNVRENLELAERLGAEIVTLTGDDTATVIVEYARISGITNIVVGKSVRSRSLRSLYTKDLEDQLIAAMPNIEVHIIPGDPGEPNAKRKPVVRQIIGSTAWSWGDAGKVLALLTVATLFSMLLRAFGIGDQNVIMIYILSVLVVSRTTTGYLYSTVSSVLSVLAFNFFFTEPRYTFTAIQPGYPITFLIMFLVALITSALSVRIKTQARLAVLRERRTEVLFEINKKLLVTRGLENIVELVNSTITNLFSRSVIFYTQEPSDTSAGHFLQSGDDPDAAFMMSPDERAVAHWAFINHKFAGNGTDTLMGAGALYVPVMSQGKSLGVIGLSCTRGKFNQTNRLFLQTIVSQVAMALERQYLSDEHRQILVDSAKEKMRSNLLRAISHDLRTPLTGIFGASSVILEDKDKLDGKTRDELVANIRNDSQWLIRMVENLLSVTRIDEGTMVVKKVPEAAEEIIAEAVARMRTRYPQHEISVRVPDVLLMVPMDGILIEQVLINLLENAIKHSPADAPVLVMLCRSGDSALFEVVDHGKGLAECDLPFVFDSYSNSERQCQDSSRGMGIGLSICMSIIKAHGGSMEAANHKDGGAVFRFLLPLKEGESN